MYVCTSPIANMESKLSSFLFPDLPASIKQTGYVARDCHSFSYPACCQKCLVAPGLNKLVKKTPKQVIKLIKFTIFIAVSYLQESFSFLKYEIKIDAYKKYTEIFVEIPGNK